MKTFHTTKFSSAFMCAVLLAPAATWAQSGSQDEARGKAEVQPVCLARSAGNDGVAAQGPQGRTSRIVVMPRSVRGLEAKGFEQVDCEGAGLSNRGQIMRFRNRMCTLAATGNEAVQNQLERALGERPAALCANAELLAGEWRRETDREPLRE